MSDLGRVHGRLKPRHEVRTLEWTERRSTRFVNTLISLINHIRTTRGLNRSLKARRTSETFNLLF